MKQKIQQTVVKMMEAMDFNEVKHRYARKEDGKYLAGVTEVAKLADTKDWAIPYGAKRAVEFLGYFDEVEGEDNRENELRAAEQLKAISKMGMVNYIALLKEAKGAAYRQAKDAAELGSEWHECLENKIKSIIRGGEPVDYPKGNEWAKTAVEGFFGWCEGKDTQFVLSEARVVNLSEEYAGTLDCCAIVNGEPAIIDFKFSNNIGVSWPLQTAAYARTFRDYGIDIKKRFVFRFPKTEHLKNYDKQTRKYKKVKNELQIIEYPESSLNFDYETFLNLRKASKWINSVK